MASILPGYEYGIFISYHQYKDKYYGCMTEFIDNLKRELHVAFVEDISIYFDEYPRTCLSEIHNADENPVSKIKSLVLVPGISQTYSDCDDFLIAEPVELKKNLREKSLSNFYRLMPRFLICHQLVKNSISSKRILKGQIHFSALSLIGSGN